MSLFGCDPALEVGRLDCFGSPRGGDLSAADATPFPWVSGFERGFCDYNASYGFCYSDPGARFEVVSEPVHSGRLAAAFSISAGDPNAQQARCVRQGTLPAAAYYGAWYLIPGSPTSNGNWNLFHFEGAGPGELHALWDVSLSMASNGEFRLTLFDFLRGVPIYADDAPVVPIGKWFHVQLYLRRAADETGEVALYQDGQLVYRFTELVTDDSNWGQWYIGNLAVALTPPHSTIYVDDVTIAETL